MARLQTDPQTPSLETLLAEANATVLAHESEKKSALQFCPTSLTAKMAQLDEMPEKELRKLVQRVSRAMLGIGLMNDEELAEAALLRLIITGLQTDDSAKALANIREWLDRKRGKPAQSIYTEVKQVIDISQLEARARELKRIANERIKTGKVIENGE